MIKIKEINYEFACKLFKDVLIDELGELTEINDEDVLENKIKRIYELVIEQAKFTVNRCPYCGNSQDELLGVNENGVECVNCRTFFKD